MTLTQSTALLLAAAIGAAGALISQLISAIANARRDKAQRLKDELLRQEQRNDAERDRFFDLRRQTYVAFIARLQPWVTYVGLISDQGSGNRHPPEDYVSFERDVDDLRAELALIAPPEIVSTAESVWVRLATSLVQNDFPDLYPEDRRRPVAAGTLDAWVACRRLMRADLAGEPLEAPDQESWGQRSDQENPAKEHVRQLRRLAEDRVQGHERSRPSNPDNQSTASDS